MGNTTKAAKAQQNQAHKEAYYWYKEHGLCPRCHKYCIPGRVYCPDCARKNYESLYRDDPTGEKNAARCKARREMLKARGRCVRCGKKAVEGRVLCMNCARKNSEAQQVRKMRRRLKREAEKP